MNRNTHLTTKLLHKQKGVAAVEFAIVASLLFTLVIGIMEFGRVLYMINTGTEATRLGARLAVVCDMNDGTIIEKMRMMANFLPADADNIKIDYQPSGCDINSCRYVTVRIEGWKFSAITSLIPIINGMDMPTLATTLPRESMTSANNVICS